jgi:hypothetical protein
MSMPVVLRGAKKLRVNAALRDSLTAADVGNYLVDFLAVCTVMLDICLLGGSHRNNILSSALIGYVAQRDTLRFFATLCCALT